jgi:hypothetical protein
MRLPTKNQFPRLPGSALKVSGGMVGGVGKAVIMESLQLELRLSWAVSIKLNIQDALENVLDKVFISLDKDPISEKSLVLGLCTLLPPLDLRNYDRSE